MRGCDYLRTNNALYVPHMQVASSASHCRNMTYAVHTHTLARHPHKHLHVLVYSSNTGRKHRRGVSTLVGSACGSHSVWPCMQPKFVALREEHATPALYAVCRHLQDAGIARTCTQANTLLCDVYASSGKRFNLAAVICRL